MLLFLFENLLCDLVIWFCFGSKDFEMKEIICGLIGLCDIRFDVIWIGCGLVVFGWIL